MVYVAPLPCNLSKNEVEHIADAVANTLGVKPGEPLEPVVDHLGGRIIYGYNSDDEMSEGAIVARSLSDFTIYIS